MMTLEDISAHVEIRQVLAAYSRGVDRWDVETLRSVYHPDATDEHTVFNGLGWDFAEWIVAFNKRNGGVSQHHITHSMIDVQGASANVESYYIAYHELVDPETGRSTLLNTGGRYLDRFERRDGVWKVAKRICTIDWSRENIAGQSWDGASAFPKVGPLGADPMYTLFAEPVRAENAVA